MSHHVWNWSKSTQYSKCQELPWLLNTSLPPAAKKNHWNVFKNVCILQRHAENIKKENTHFNGSLPKFKLIFKKSNSECSRTMFGTCTAVLLEARYSTRVLCLLIITRQTIRVGNPSKFQECKSSFSTHCYHIARGRSLWTLLRSL